MSLHEDDHILNIFPELSRLWGRRLNLSTRLDEQSQVGWDGR